MACKLRLRAGQVEVEFEGEESFAKKELPELFRMLAELRLASEPDGEGADGKQDGGKRKRTVGGRHASTSTIAGKLGHKSGANLVVAACAHLTLVKGDDSFDRKAILAEMKNATTYYRTTYMSNLGSYLKRLVDGHKLNEVANGKYALDAGERERLEQILGE